MALVLRENPVSWRGTTYEPCGRPLGDGGTSNVYRVIAKSGPTKGIFFAAKVFQQIEDSTRLLNFMREVHFLRSVKHPAIMSIEDEGRLSDNRPFVIIELQKSTLEKEKQRQSLSFLQKSVCGLSILSALNYLSRQDPPMVHRDIKPSNIFIKGESFLLGDFGLVTPFLKSTQRSGPPPKIAEMAKMYPTPELVKSHLSGRQPPPESDVFQFGLVAAELFTGQKLAKWNQRSEKIDLSPVPEIVEPSGDLFRPILVDMLKIENRPPVHELLDRWLTAHQAAAESDRDRTNRKIGVPPPSQAEQ
jgi:serine/threonine protein kinase